MRFLCVKGLITQKVFPLMNGLSTTMESPKIALFGGQSSKCLKISKYLEDKLFLAIHNGDVKVVQSLLDQGVDANSTCLFGRTALGTASHLGNVEIVKLLLRTFFPASSISIFPKIETYQENEISSSCCGSGSFQASRNALGSFEDNGETVPSSVGDRLKGEEIPCDCPESAVPPNTKTDVSRISTQHILEGRNISQRMCANNDGNHPSELESATAISIQKCRPQPNQGYFVVVHRDDSQAKHELENTSLDVNLNEPKTPDDMDSLEWDNELQHDYKLEFEEEQEPDSWIDLYRWYADHLAKSCSVGIQRINCVGSKPDVNQLDVYHRSAMHYAAEQGHLEVMHVLISAGCHVDVGDSDDVTPLHLAAARDYPEAVALLISCGATVNRRSLDRTGPLHMAAARGFMETARILLTHGASVNASDRSDRTPLMLAVARGLDDMVQLLIDQGAKVNVEDIHGYTPLCQAVWQQEKGLVELLLEAGAKLTHSDRLLHYAILHRCFDVAKLLVGAGSIVNLRDDSGDTPLIIAARTGQVDVASLLLQNGAVANYPNGLTGSTPLHEAVGSLRPAQHATLKLILRVLLDHGARLSPHSSTDFDSPLVRALVHDNDQAMILLIQHGADVNLLQQHTAVVSDAYLKRRPDRWIIAQLMINAGLDLWNLTPDIKVDMQCLEESASSWIVQTKFNPMSLARQSRIQFRRHFGENLYWTILRSGFPSRLKEFIMLEDIVCIDELPS